MKKIKIKSCLSREEKLALLALIIACVIISFLLSGLCNGCF